MRSMLILVLLAWRPTGKFNKKKTGPSNTLMVSKSHAVSSRSGAGVFMHCGWICKSASGARRKSARANVIVLAWLPCSTSAAFGHHPWSWSTLWSSDPKWARNTIFSFFLKDRTFQLHHWASLFFYVKWHGTKKSDMFYQCYKKHEDLIGWRERMI